MEVTRFDFALAQLRVNPAKVKSFPVSEHPSGTRAGLLRSIPTNFIRRVARYKSLMMLDETQLSSFTPPVLLLTKSSLPINAFEMNYEYEMFAYGSAYSQKSWKKIISDEKYNK